MSGLACKGRLASEEGLGGEFCGPVWMLLRCVGFGGALGRGPPVLEIVAGAVIGFW